MVSNKKYKYALEKWNEWENMATDVAKQNGILLKEMKEINDLSMRIHEHNGALIAECRKLREQLAAVTIERNRHRDLLPTAMIKISAEDLEVNAFEVEK